MAIRVEAAAERQVNLVERGAPESCFAVQPRPNPQMRNRVASPAPCYIP